MIRWFAVAMLGCMLLAAACVGMATQEGSVQTTQGLDGEGPWQQFIIKYRPDSAPGRDPHAAQAKLENADYPAGAGANPFARLEWKRRLGVGADLFMTDRPLDRDEARRLFDALAADPEVQYVEAETMMQALPVQPQRPR